MEKVIHICDRCGCEKVYSKSSDSDFRKVQFRVGKKGETYIYDGQYFTSVATQTEMLLCSECQLKLGIHGKGDNQDINFHKQPELIDRVFELFSDIADEIGYVRE